MASMWGDVDRGVETRKEAIDRARIHTLEKLLEEKHRELERSTREGDALRKSCEREKLKVGKLEEELLAERQRRDAVETKHRRTEARAEAAEAEVSTHEGLAVEANDLRSSLRVAEQRLAALRAQLGTERQRGDDGARNGADLQERLSAELAARGEAEHKLQVAERSARALESEAAALKETVERLQTEALGVMSQASTEAQGLNQRAQLLEGRLQQIDAAGAMLELRSEERDAANARARELARQVAVEQAQREAAESLARHQRGELDKMLGELEEAKGAAGVLAREKEQADLSLLMVRTGFSAGREPETIGQVRQQLLLEQREHAVLKMDHAEATRKIGALECLLRDGGRGGSLPRGTGGGGGGGGGGGLYSDGRGFGSPPMMTPPAGGGGGGGVVGFGQGGGGGGGSPLVPLVAPSGASPVWESQASAGAAAAATTSPEAASAAVPGTPPSSTVAAPKFLSPQQQAPPPPATRVWPTAAPPPTTRIAMDNQSDGAESRSSKEEQAKVRHAQLDRGAMLRRAAIMDAMENSVAITPQVSRMEALVSHQKQLAAQKALAIPSSAVTGVSSRQSEASR